MHLNCSADVPRRTRLHSSVAGSLTSLLVLILWTTPGLAEAFGVSADTVFAGDWGHGGKSLLQLPAGHPPLGVLHQVGAGTYILWQELVNGTTRARVTLLNEQGDPAPGWSSLGTPVSSDTSGQFGPHLISDGRTGAFVGWIDGRDSTRLYMQHLERNGSIAPGWPSGGRRLLPDGWQNSFLGVPDSAGGAFIAWTRGRPGRWASVLVVRVDSLGSVMPGWEPTGLVIAEGDSTRYPSDGISYELRNLYVGGHNSAYVDYVAYPYCTGHGCYPVPYYELVLVTAARGTGHAQISTSMQWRTSAPDMRGGIGTLFYWTPQFILEHYGRDDAGGYWFTEPPLGPNEIYSDARGGVLLGAGIHFFRYALDGTPDPLWGGASGTMPVALPHGWYGHRVFSDEAGGFFLVWEDNRAHPSDPEFDLYANLIDEDGTREPGWLPGGLPIVTASPNLSLLSAFAVAPKEAIVLWTVSETDRVTLYGQHISASQPVPAEVALVSASATSNAVRLIWDTPSGASGSYLLERSSINQDWARLASISPDGSGRLEYLDSTVRPGVSYGFRLSSTRQPPIVTWVTIPERAEFSLAGAATNPSLGPPRVHFSLAGSLRSRLELWDIAGRRVRDMDVTSLGPGVHDVGFQGRLSPGLYLIRLQEGNRVGNRRVAVIR